MSVDISSTRGRDTFDVRTESGTIETPFGIAPSTRIYPSAFMSLRSIKEQPPVVISSGWGENMSAVRLLGEKIAEAGYATTIFDYPNMSGQRIDHTEVQAVRAAVLGSVLDAEHGESAIVAHSEGAFAALHAAAHRDDILAALLAAPAGLSGEFTPAELVKCAFQEGKEAAFGTRTNVLGAVALMKAFGGLVRDVAGRPGLSVAEVRSIAETDAVPDLDLALERNVRLGIIACSKDRIFPAERIEAHLDGRENKIFRYTVLDTTHSSFLRQPEVTREIVTEVEMLLDHAS